jgi:8-oxo-dGTP pyrophosphatase MutT (NUDIX family)
VRGEPLFREHGTQAAALCWRLNPGLEILLITSRNSKRWIVPKGWLMADLGPAESAAREAMEEAGITGDISQEPLGTFYYLKEKKDGSVVACSVDVFSLHATGQQADWPEKGTRELMWLSPDQAAMRVAEPGLRRILQDFARNAPAIARRAG